MNDTDKVSTGSYAFLVFLTLLNVMNFVDRQLLASFANFIVPDLGLSNTEFGLLTGLPIESGKLFNDIGLPPLNPEYDRAMICGSPAMLKDCCAMLDSRGFEISRHIGDPGDYVIERAFVEK